MTHHQTTKIIQRAIHASRWFGNGIVLETCMSSENQNNFKLIRLVAALSVVVLHSKILISAALGLSVTTDFHLLGLGLPSFFFLSGLLVAQSLEKSSSWRQFLWKRCLRLYPAACLSIVSSALILGPIVTSWDIKAYFQSPQVYKYLSGCSLVRIYYLLPGVFENSVTGTRGINNSLWSLTLEWKLYAGLLIAWTVNFPFKRFLLFTLILCAAGGGYFFYDAVADITTKITGRHIHPFAYVKYVPLFLIGVLCNVYKKTLVIRNYWALAIPVFFFISKQFHILGLTGLILIPAFVLFAASHGIQVLRKVTPTPDLSYGIYVFAFPIQQVVANYIRPESVLVMSFLSIAFVLPVAVLSWYGFEKRALQWKRLIK